MTADLSHKKIFIILVMGCTGTRIISRALKVFGANPDVGSSKGNEDLNSTDFFGLKDPGTIIVLLLWRLNELLRKRRQQLSMDNRLAKIYE